MKFNWGTGIFTFLILFIATLAFVLYKSRQYHNSLVMNNYYEEDLAYQKQYDKIKNYQSLDSKLSFNYLSAKKSLEIVFPYDASSKVSGQVQLYRPSSDKDDFVVPIQIVRDSVMLINTTEMKSGRWLVKVNWTWKSKDIYTEEEILIK